jgi:Ca2+/H+ antiporter, TMEM165/GDT1 family
VKWVAALIFIFFGIYGLYESLPVDVLTVPVLIAGLTAVTVAAYILGRSDSKRTPPICETSE